MRALVVPVALACAPEQVHLAFAGADAHAHSTGMNVAWFTHDKCDSLVQFGETALDGNASGTSAEYLLGEGWHHNVRVTGLKPGTLFKYRVGSAGSWSPGYTFRTAPGTDSTASFKFAVFGDMGWEDSTLRPMVLAVKGLERHWDASHSRALLGTLQEKGELDWVWHTGDIGYIDDAFAHNPLTFHYETAYNGFMNWIENLTSRMPYMVSPGNHESECHSPACILSLFKHRGKRLENFTAYNARWHMPGQDSGARPGQSMWHAFNYGPVHFVSVNTETDFPGAEERDVGDSGIKFLKAGHFGQPGEYLAWVEADLKAASAARAAKDAGGAVGPAFIVVGGHRPYKDLTADHTALFAKYGVDLYLSGHGHSYTRSYPVNGTTYIMAGGAGCEEMALPADSATLTLRARPGPAVFPGYASPAGTEAFASGRLSIGTLECSAEALHFELLDSKSGAVLDQVTITKQAQDTLRRGERTLVV